MGVKVADVAECYDKHGEALLRFAASQVGWSDAGDVLSVAVLGVLQHQGSDITDLRAYLYRAVANAGYKHWRSLDRRVRRELAFRVPGAVAEAGDGTEPELLAALADLSVQQRAVVHLTYWEDLTPSAVAARLGVTEGTVRKQLARARHRLREVLDDRG